MKLDKLQQPQSMRQKGYKTFIEQNKEKSLKLNEKGTCITNDGMDTERDQFGNSRAFGGDSFRIKTDSMRDSKFNTHYANGKFVDLFQK